MKRSACVVLLAALFAGSSHGLSAQPAAVTLTEAQQLGMRLYNQSCVVCHEKPQITSGQYAPVLSRKSAGSREDVMREVITNGTPRMPGFKYQFEPPLIDAIVAYLKTMPAPAPAAR